VAGDSKAIKWLESASENLISPRVRRVILLPSLVIPVIFPKLVPVVSPQRTKPLLVVLPGIVKADA